MCPTLCDMDYSLPVSSLHGILQARILEWIAIPFSRRSSQSRNRTRVSCIAGRFFTNWATREIHQRLTDEYPEIPTRCVLSFKSKSKEWGRCQDIWMGGEVSLQVVQGDVAQTMATGNKMTDNSKITPFSQADLCSSLSWPWPQNPQRIKSPQRSQLPSARVGLIKEIGCYSRKGYASSSKLEQEFN